VGTLVREAEQQGCELTALPPASFHAAHPLFGDDVQDALSPVSSVAQREAEGGTGPEAVKVQLREARHALADVVRITRAANAFFAA
jgi:argininosuccinate lyase